jgi:hypothetical protein
MLPRLWAASTSSQGWLGEHHQPCAGLQGTREPVLHRRGSPFNRSPQIGHGQPVDRQAFALGKLPAGSHHAGMLTVTEQQPIAGLPGQPPKGQHTTTGDIFCEGQPAGTHPQPAGQRMAKLPGRAVDVGPDSFTEGAQLLDSLPAGHDRLQARLGQGALASVVEIDLIGEGGHQRPKGFGH